MRFVFSALMLLLLAGVSRAVVVDFEDWTSGTGERTVAQSNGYKFEARTGTFSIDGALLDNQYLSMHSGSFYVTRSDGGLFSLESIAFRREADGLADYIVVTGYGPTSFPKYQFWLDADPSVWRTFDLSAYKNMSLLWIESYRTNGGYGYGPAFAMDDIVAVPEPHSICLLLMFIIFSPLIRK